MAEEDRRNRDIVLAPNEWTHVRDNTKGEVNVYVGPTKVTLGDGDKLRRPRSSWTRPSSAPFTPT
jgi:hypothetical protein